MGLLFLLSLPLAPLVGAIPASATARALIIVGSMMASHVAEIRWTDPVIAIPAFLIILAIPLTFSIASGLAFGFTFSINYEDYCGAPAFSRIMKSLADKP